MALVSHNPRYRRMWMVPRNIRNIPAWKIAQLLLLFQQRAGDRQWSGDPQLQLLFRRALERLGLKKPGRQRDRNPGGDRTYAKQLECLGLVFRRPNGSYGLTIAGQEIVDGKPSLGILQTQLIRHQYPSAYGYSQNIWINPEIRVKPFIFILELLRLPEIQHLTDEEIIIAVVYGHNHSCLKFCSEKIMELRAGKKIREIIDNPKEDFHTRKTKGDAGKRLVDARHIANTFRCYAASTNLVIVDASERLERIFFNPAIEELFEREYKGRDVYVPSPEDHESFQRAYGRWTAGRDSRADAETTPQSLDLELGCINAHLRGYCEIHAVENFPETVLLKLTAEYGYSAEKVRQAAEQMLPRVRSIFDARLLELSRCRGDVVTARLFEEAVCALFRDRLHFEVEHTGARKRKGVGGYADIFIRSTDQRHCAILDAKSIAKYDLPASDYRAMVHDYIPTYSELVRDPGNLPELEFAGYVLGGASSALPGRLREAASATGVSCMAISAEKLLEIANKYPNAADQHIVRKLLAQSGIAL